MKKRSKHHSQQRSKRFSKATIAMLALSGSLAAVSVAAEAPETAWADTSTMHSGPVLVNQQNWRNVPYVVANGTTFFGIWYLQQLLGAYGIGTKWDGKTLSLDSVPQVYGSSVLTVNGAKQSASPTLSYQGNTYIDVSSLASATGSDLTYSSATKSLTVSLPSGGPNQQTAVALSTTPAENSAGTNFAVRSSSGTVPMSTGYVRENGRLWKSVPILRRDGTTFFGVYYLQTFLRAHGIQSTWNGKQLSIENLPRIVKGTSLHFGGGTASSTLLQWGTAWYAPANTLKQLGVTVQTDTSHNATVSMPTSTKISVQGLVQNADGTPLVGKVAIQDANGNVQVVNTDNTGRFASYIQTLGGYLIGIETPTDGWTGESVALSSGSSVTARDVQNTSAIHGTLSFAGKAFSVSEVSLRNVITHAHYYAQVVNGQFTVNVPEGAYEVYALVTDTDALYLAQPFVTTGVNTSLTVSVPALPTGTKVETEHAIVTAADSSVTPEDLQSVADLFERVYPYELTRTGLKPNDKMNIVLYGDANSYAAHFTAEGYSTDEAGQIADNSVAAEEGPNLISVLMPSYAETDGMNILAHEFTHALVATVSSQIDSWANEGIAWVNGIAGELDQSPDELLLQGDQWYEWVDIVAHQQQGDLLPLGGANPLDGNYNVEDQDYFAVQQLIDKYGMDKFMQYVKAIDSDPDAFLHTFGETFDQFSQEVTQKLAQAAGQTNTSFTARLKVLPGGPSEAYVINSGGQTFTITGMKPGNVYNIVCNSDGTVSAPTGLTVTPASANLPVFYDGDWYVGTDGDGTQPRQEFEVGYEFGQPFLVQALLYTSEGEVEHAYPATAVPEGIQLIGLDK